MRSETNRTEAFAVEPAIWSLQCHLVSRATPTMTRIFVKGRSGRMNCIYRISLCCPPAWTLLSAGSAFE